jgi:mannose-6-phosphate isomerase-like protein (cupin superfamily)
MTLPSSRMFQQRPPTADESLARMLDEQAGEGPRRPLVPIRERAAGRAGAKAAAADVAADKAAAPAAVPPSAGASIGASAAQFKEIYSSPENQVFKVVFFPDRVFHAQYLNACRSPQRYRYAVSDARSILDISALKAQVFMDGRKAANLLRIEYRGSRLIEMCRQSGRFLRDQVIAWVKAHGRAYLRDEHGRILAEDGTVYREVAGPRPATEARSVEAPVLMHFCPWIDAFQVEIWQTLEPPSAGTAHDFQVLAQMGPAGSITRVRQFSPLLEMIDSLGQVELAFRESDVERPHGRPIAEPRWDNNYERSYQAPNSPFPSDNKANTVAVGNYLITFQKGWFLDANKVAPVRYRNAMMDAGNPEYVAPDLNPALNDPAAWQTPAAASFTDANVIEMRWLLQREFGGSVVFFHEVTIPPGTVEGTHCHVGSEELYYIVSGEGIAYMAAGDDPATEAAGYNKVQRHVFGLFERECVELPVRPGNVIFTKSGGVHGIKNVGAVPLKFVAFLYHSV